MLELIYRCLRDGTFPPDDMSLAACLKAAEMVVIFEMYAAETGAAMAVHLVDRETDEAVVVKSVDDMWRELSVVAAAEKLDAVTSKFKGIGIVPITKGIDAYVTYSKLLVSKCQTCGTEYLSGVNRLRCEVTHLSKKRPEEKAMLSLSGLRDFWDGLDDARRGKYARLGMRFLQGIPCSDAFSPAVNKLVALAAGDASLTGSELLVALDEASEYTFCYKLRGPIAGTKLETRSDYVAALAHVVVDALSRDHADSVADALMEEAAAAEPEAAKAKAKAKTSSSPPKKKKKKKGKKSPSPKPEPEVAAAESPVPSEDERLEDEDDAMERLLAADVDYQMRMERALYLQRVEHLVWGTDLLDVSCWADDM